MNTTLRIARKHTIPIINIHYLEGSCNYSIVHQIGAKPIMIARSLKRLEPEAPTFWRIHKQYLVNPDSVVRLLTDSVLLTTGEKLSVSRRRWNKMAQLMRNREFDKQQLINNQ